MSTHTYKEVFSHELCPASLTSHPQVLKFDTFLCILWVCMIQTVNLSWYELNPVSVVLMYFHQGVELRTVRWTNQLNIHIFFFLNWVCFTSFCSPSSILVLQLCMMPIICGHTFSAAVDLSSAPVLSSFLSWHSLPKDPVKNIIVFPQCKRFFHLSCRGDCFLYWGKTVSLCHKPWMSQNQVWSKLKGSSAIVSPTVSPSWMGKPAVGSDWKSECSVTKWHSKVTF